MQLVVVRVDELPDDAEARLLEGPERGRVPHVRVGGARGRRGPREDDLVHEAADQLGAQPASRLRLVADEEVEPGGPSPSPISAA